MREYTEHPSFLETYFANTRSRYVHDDWSVAKPREECQGFTVTIHNPENVSKSLTAGLERAQNGARVLKSHLPSGPTAGWILSRSQRIRAERSAKLYREAMAA